MTTSHAGAAKSGRRIDPLSFTTAPIEIFASDGSSCAKASGFFYSRDEKYIHYVTNWHVVACRDPANPNSVAHGWKVPRQAKLTVHKRLEDKPGIMSLAHKAEVSIDLNDELGESPNWFEHATFGIKVDVVVLRIGRAAFDAAALYQTITECDLSSTYQESVMDDVFVIGYPWGLHGGDKVLPLYKRGSIASEPIIDQQKLPRFLIDCRTTPSMSGSPVIASHSGVWSPDGQLSQETVMGTINKFVGVFSGRLYDHEGAAQPTEICQVWKRSVIDEIIATGVKGRGFCSL